MHKPILTLLVLAGLPMALSMTAYAATTQLGQKILPLNCVFEEVNDGLGSLYYLTPKECGIVTPPSQSVPQPSQSSPVFVRSPSTPTYTPQPVTGSLDVRAVLPWRPIVAVVQGDGTVVVGSQPSDRQTGNSSLLSATGRLFSTIGDAMRPTAPKVAVGVTGSMFIALVLILALA